MKKETISTLLKFLIGFLTAILGGLSANAAVAFAPTLVAML